MGVPKFFAWLSERYPCIISTISEAHTPEYDYLYLDMNGVIHTCTHPEDKTVETNMTEDEMAVACFKYVDKLFHLIRPRKMLFMAVDGVAPRAKMNQQRARRFVSAREAAAAMKKEEEKGNNADKMYFDSNCITPGTQFMTKLSEGLKFFIQKKIKEDPFWRRVDVVLSGHEVPGEGEHKIMDFIRSQRADSNHDPNTRHCLYGLDADLILLGLASHEPHFSLLREHVVFGRRVVGGQHKPRKGQPHEKSHPDPAQDFRLLHLSILRSYLQLEFTLKNATPSHANHPPQVADTDGDTPEYDIERMLDDFNVLCYFIGNDFLPHLPFRDIAKGSLNALLEKYRVMLPSMSGYICNKDGEIEYERLADFIEKIMEDEEDLLSDRYGDVDWDPSAPEPADRRNFKKRGPKPREIPANEPWPDMDKIKELEEEDLDGEEIILTPQLLNAAYLNQFSALEDVPEDIDAVDAIAEADVDFVDVEEGEEEEEEEEGIGGSASDRAIEDVRWTYYTEKWGDEANKEGDYVEGLAWVYQYYFRGVPSWMWFYPHHYAPLARDLAQYLRRVCSKSNESSVRVEQNPKYIKFDLSTPFLPFEQLLAVLPPFSGKFLPQSYARLMTDTNSPILDFYPEKFDTDLNGKRQDWEAVVLISFIDEARLLEAARDANKFLTNEEKKRNRHGDAHVYHYDLEADIPHVPSPIPALLPSLSNVPVVSSVLTVGRPDILRPVLLDGCRIAREAPPGFPTLATLPHFAYLKLAPQEGRQRRGPPKRPVMMIRVQRSLEDARKNRCQAIETADDSVPSNLTEASKLIGQSLLVDWPYLKEAMVIAVMDKHARIGRDTGGMPMEHRNRGASNEEVWRKMVNDVVMGLDANRGIDVGNVDILVEAALCEGVIEFSDGTVRKVFSDEIQRFAIHHVLYVDKAPHLAGAGPHSDTRRIERLAPPTLKEKLEVGTQVVYLGLVPYSGTVGVVHGQHDSKFGFNLSLAVSAATPPIPPRIAVRPVSSSQGYHPSYECTKMLGMHPLALAKIAAQIRVDGDKRVVGLGIKFDGRGLEAAGLSRRTVIRDKPIWEYHSNALAMIHAYRQAFPVFFTALEKQCSQPNPHTPITAQMLRVDAKGLTDMIHKMINFQHDVLHLDKIVLVPVNSQFLAVGECTQLVQAIDKTVNDAKTRFAETLKKQPHGFLLLKNVNPNNVIILESGPNCNRTVPKKYELPASKFQLYDRVVVGCTGGGFGSGTEGVPCGTYGVVMGIFNDRVDVVLDEPVLGGGSLDGRCPDRRGASVVASSLINLSVFGVAMKRGKVVTPHAPQSAPMPNAWTGGRGQGRGHLRDAQRGRGRGVMSQSVKILPRKQPVPPVTALPVPAVQSRAPVPAVQSRAPVPAVQNRALVPVVHSTMHTKAGVAFNPGVSVPVGRTIQKHAKRHQKMVMEHVSEAPHASEEHVANIPSQPPYWIANNGTFIVTPNPKDYPKPK